MTRRKKMILITAGLCLACGLLAIGALFGLRIPCLFYEVTGLHCGGCGNTRATIALLHLDFGKMLHYNLLYPLEIFYIGRVYCHCAVNYVKKGRFSYRKKPYVFDIVFLTTLVIWTIVRNITPLF